MDDLISRQAVKEWLERWEGYLDTDMIARMQLKVADIPTHETPSKALDALDCISRQKAIEAIEEMQKPIMRSEDIGEQFVFRGMSEALNGIKELPSVQPRKGKWIDGMCTECEESTQGFLTNFCPNCGADMRGGQE